MPLTNSSQPSTEAQTLYGEGAIAMTRDTSSGRMTPIISVAGLSVKEASVSHVQSGGFISPICTSLIILVWYPLLFLNEHTHSFPHSFTMYSSDIHYRSSYKLC